MRKLIVHAFLTLDGVMQAPGSPNDRSGGFTHGGWTVPFWDDAIEAWQEEATSGPFDLLLGRKTYEIFAGYWPRATDVEGAEVFNDARKYVVSRTLRHLDWQNSTFVDGHVGKAVAQLKEMDGPEIQVQGSGNLVQTLLSEDLVDGLRLLLYPIVLGRGKRLFAEGTIPRAFTLEGSTTSPSGVVMARYERSGDITLGSFVQEESAAEVKGRDRHGDD
jgi:dihydrofolate reductase